MTSPDDWPTGQPEQERYPLLLDALVAAAVAKVLAAYDGITSDLLVEEIPPILWGLLVETLAAVLHGTNTAARTLATLHVDAVLAEARQEPLRPSPVPERDGELDALRQAVTTTLERAAEIAAHPAEPEPIPEPRQEPAPSRPVESERGKRLREEQRARATTQRERVAAAERARRERIVEDARRSRAAVELAARVRREQQDRTVERARAAVAREEERAKARDAAERDKIDRQIARLDAAEARRVMRNAERAAEVRRAKAEADRLAAARAVEVRREERRQAQRDRLERLARSQANAAAATVVEEAAQGAPEVLGWIRRLNNDACETCRAWWRSGPGTFTPVRPMSVRMKRHPGCSCTQVLITHEEEVKARGLTTEPEPVSDRWKRARDRERAAAGAAASSPGDG